MTTQSMPDGCEDLVFVSGYCAVGTGPVSQIRAFFSDMFGKSSGAIGEKIEEAEITAVRRMEESAVSFGADSIYNMKVQLIEATNNYGMIVAYATGNAAVRER